MRGRWTLLLLLLPLSGCASMEGFGVLAAWSIPVVRTEKEKPLAEATAVDPAEQSDAETPPNPEEPRPESLARWAAPLPEGMDVSIDTLRRGPRGGSFILRVKNTARDQALMLDWSRVVFRLGNGQFRKPITDNDFLQLCMEFGFAAYGWSEIDLKTRTPGVAYPLRGEIHRLKPGESLALTLHFGAPEQETSLFFDLGQALSWETLDGQPLGTVEPGVRGSLGLPPIAPPRPPSWWPDWLHVGVFISNGW
jgi:hypothetical protein